MLPTYNGSPAPIVMTRYGQISGVQVAEANIYLGIPYAQPPVNNLRWQDPIDALPWSPSILDGTAFRAACPQYMPDCIPTVACPDTVLEYFF